MYKHFDDAELVSSSEWSTDTSVSVSGVTVSCLREFLLFDTSEQDLRRMLLEHLPGQLVDIFMEPSVSGNRFPDIAFTRVLQAMSGAWGLTEQEFTIEFGRFMLTWLLQKSGYEESIFQVARTFIDFARCMFQVVVQMFATLGTTTAAVPEVHVTEVTEVSFMLGAFKQARYPHRSTLLLRMCLGALSKAGSQVFGIEIKYSAEETRRLQDSSEYQAYRVTFPATTPRPLAAVATSTLDKRDHAHHMVASNRCSKAAIGLDSHDFVNLFPFHFVIDANFKVLQAGEALKTMLPDLAQPGIYIGQVLSIQLPHLPWNRHCLDIILENDKHTPLILTSQSGCQLKGTMHRIHRTDHQGGGLQQGDAALLCLVLPVLTSVEDMKLRNLYFSDFPAHDGSLETLLAAEHRHRSQVSSAAALKNAEESNAALRQTLIQTLVSTSPNSSRSQALGSSSAGDLMLKLLNGMLVGETAEVERILAIRSALLKSGGNVWRPLDFESQVMGGDEEVRHSLRNLLVSSNNLSALNRSANFDDSKQGVRPSSEASPALKPNPANGSRPFAAGVRSLSVLVPTGKLQEESMRLSSLRNSFHHELPFIRATHSSSDKVYAQGQLKNAKNAWPFIPFRVQSGDEAPGDEAAKTSRTVRKPVKRASSFYVEPVKQLLGVKGRVHPQPQSPGTLAFQPSVQLPSLVPLDKPAGQPHGPLGPQNLSKKLSASRLMVSSRVDEACATPTGPEMICMQPADKVSLTLMNVTEWQFDAFELEGASDQRPLSCLAFHLMKTSGLVKQLGMNERRLASFLMQIENGYRDNPYHNRTHAADVLRSLHVIMTRGGLQKAMAQWTPQELQASQDSGSNNHLHAPPESMYLLSCYLAAVVHDYEHKGVNNDFLTRTNDPLAIRYNDVSPMENHHLAAAFALLQEEQYDFMDKVPSHAKRCIRKNVIALVLATDMKQHFTVTGAFTSKFIKQEHKQEPQAPMRLPSAGDPEDDLLILKMALKCSDLGHLVSSREVHKNWVAKLEEELFLQGDLERALGVPLSPLMDRTKQGIQKSQSSFFSVVARPMFTSFVGAFPRAAALLENLNHNQAYWRGLEGEANGTAAAG